MQQRVKNVSYLAKSTINLATDLNNLSRNCIALPQGAEVMQATLSVDEVADAGTTAKLGLNENASFFVASCALDKVKCFQSAQIETTTKPSVITLTLNQQPTAGKVTLRVVYFLPSEIMTEYAD